jgi:TolA-binding protein
VSINGETLESAALSNWLSAPSNASLPISFSDGTRVDLMAKSRARVLRVGEHGAHVVLESGDAHLKVIPTENANWQVSAGPFLVNVVGTRFDVAWSPDDDVFTLELHEGKVNLSGCLFGSGRSLVAGETVRASCKTKEYEIKTRGAKQASEGKPQSTDAETDAAASIERPAAEASPPKPTAANWQALARAGKYKEAVALAAESGFDKVLGQASAADLTLLGDAARFSGDSAKAISAYSALRSRYPGGERAANAAYAMARLNFDQRGAVNEAARWFRTYLSEHPDGSLAREAQGRLLECLRRAGNRAAAERQADLYLERYPDGPHADLARSVTPKKLR